MKLDELLEKRLRLEHEVKTAKEPTLKLEADLMSVNSEIERAQAAEKKRQLAAYNGEINELAREAESLETELVNQVGAMLTRISDFEKRYNRLRAIVQANPDSLSMHRVDPDSMIQSLGETLRSYTRRRAYSEALKAVR